MTDFLEYFESGTKTLPRSAECEAHFESEVVNRGGSNQQHRQIEPDSGGVEEGDTLQQPDQRKDDAIERVLNDDATERHTENQFVAQHVRDEPAPGR